eukprot:m.22358 g.22358  ORF g.22358 m.22358 type:complete len:307 (-) comp10716_c0_seq1:41-961(-)
MLALFRSSANPLCSLHTSSPTLARFAQNAVASRPAGYRSLRDTSRLATEMTPATRDGGCARADEALYHRLTYRMWSMYGLDRSIVCRSAPCPASPALLVRIGVRMTPGSTSLTRIPNWLTSIARDSVAASSACLDAQYDDWHGMENSPVMDDTLIMQPLWRDRIAGSTNCINRTGARKLVSINARNPSIGMSSSERRDPPIPALLTRTSIRPCSSTIESITAAHASALVTSSARTVSLTLACPSACNFFPPAQLGFRMVAKTVFPSSASRTAVANPIPVLHPVTRTIWFWGGTGQSMTCGVSSTYV